MTYRPTIRTNGRHGLTTAVALGLSLFSYTLMPSAAVAQTASGLVSAWGKACKMRVVQQFDVPNSDAIVNLGATEQQSINEGNTSLADIKKYGLSFNWKVRGKTINGYCNVNGKGAITEFKQAL
jgi:hypothetical protein